MDEPNSSNTTSQLILPQPQADQPPTLPPELILVIIQLLCHEDQQTFCLLSQSSRQLALPSVFGRIMTSHYVADRIKRLNKAGKEIKAAIKELIVNEGGWGKWDYEAILLPFLRSLPNLHSFRWNNYYSLSDGFHQLLAASLQHCPLENFRYWGPYASTKSVTAPPRLRRLSVKFLHTHVYDFIRPSFSTLVQLDIYPIGSHSSEFDLLPLRPVGRTLQVFIYRVDGFDPDILDTIPDVFPNVIGLALAVVRTTQDPRWKNSYDDAIAKNTKLQWLAVFAMGFKFCDSNPMWPHDDCRKCGNQRVEATRTLAIACTGLEKSWWEQANARYGFNVRLNKNSSKGNTLVRVKRATNWYIPMPFKRCDW